MTTEDSNLPNTNSSEHRLEEWGNERQPSVDGAFANRLETQLRERASDRTSNRQRRPIWQPIAVAAIALIAMSVGLFSLAQSSDDGVLLVMSAAFETEIILPDGEVITGSEGLLLAEGTRIIVGAAGSAVVGDVVLAPGTEALINNGKLEVLGDRRSSTTDNPSTTSEPGNPRSTTRPAANDTTTTAAGGTSRTSDVDRSTSTTTRRTTTTAVPTSDASTTAAPTTAPTRIDRPPSTIPPPPAAELTWVERDNLVQLNWSYVGQEEPAGWEVIATNGDQVRTLAVLRDPAARSITLEALEAAVSYRVIARAADGTAIVESNAVEVP